MDPLVEIHMRRNGGPHKVTYGQVTPAMVEEIIDRHIIGGETIDGGSCSRTRDQPNTTPSTRPKRS